MEHNRSPQGGRGRGRGDRDPTACQSEGGAGQRGRWLTSAARSNCRILISVSAGRFREGGGVQRENPIKRENI